MKKELLIAIVLCAMGVKLAAQTQTTDTTITLLPTMEDGPWPCCYYFINSNDELAALPVKEWAGRCAEEADWVQGWGPLSSSPDHFRTTEWGSTQLALLVRRHFTLTASLLEALANGSVTAICSYDENPKMYINGTLVWSASGWNDNDYARFTLSRRQKSLLREGDNVMAVSLQQGGGSGHIDMGLLLTYAYDPNGVQAPTAETSSRSDSPIYRLDATAVTPATTLPRGIYVQKGKKIAIP